MTQRNARPRSDDQSQREAGQTSNNTATTATAIMTRPADTFRAWRTRRWARRELDRLVDPWSYAVPIELGEPIDWRPMAMGVAERDRAGRELAAAGWTPW